MDCSHDICLYRETFLFPDLLSGGIGEHLPIYKKAMGLTIYLEKTVVMLTFNRKCATKLHKR